MTRYAQHKERVERRQKQAAALEPDEAAKPRQKIVELAYSTREDAVSNSITVTIYFSSSSTEKLSMDEMDLEVSETNLRLVSKHGSVVVDLVPIDCNSVKAKLSQKKKTLRVTLARK